MISNQFTQKFQQYFYDQKFEDQVLRLYFCEQATGHFASAAALLNAFISPAEEAGVYNASERLAKLGHIKMRADQIETLREEVSAKTLSLIDDITSAQFSSEKEAKEFQTFLQPFAGLKFSRGFAKRFGNVQTKAEVGVKLETDKRERERILQEIEAERALQSQDRQAMYQFSQQSFAQQKRLLQDMKTLQAVKA